MRFRALVVREGPTRGAMVPGDRKEAAGFALAVEERDTSELPAGELLVRVSYSSLNYKDALSAAGNRGVTKSYPHTPGIDTAGTVAESSVPAFREGDEVVVTGFDLGMNTPGGFAEFVRIPASWAVKLPAGLTPRQAMMYGTAGLTAALAVGRIEEAGIAPAAGSVLVTGAKGGVGSFSVAIFARLGFTVAAATGSGAAEAYLRALGASEVLARAELEREEARPLLHARWAAAVDTLGGAVLSNLIKSVAPGGAVAACGNAASGSFAGSVYPFILRGVSLLGVDSASYPAQRRTAVWDRLAGPWNVLDRGIRFEECGLAELAHWISAMRRGELTGRVLVDLSR